MRTNLHCYSMERRRRKGKRKLRKRRREAEREGITGAVKTMAEKRIRRTGGEEEVRGEKERAGRRV